MLDFFKFYSSTTKFLTHLCITRCSNVNFAFHGVCNRCATPRPAGFSGGAGGGGRGKGGGAADSAGAARVAAGVIGLFGPNDWSYPM